MDLPSLKNDITRFFWRDIYIAKIATVAVTLQAVYCCGPGRTSGPFVFEGRAFGLVPGNKKNLGRISGRLHFLAQNQVTTQAVKAIYSQESYWKEFFILPQSDMSRCFLKRPHGLRVERAKRKILEIGSKGYHKEALKEVYITTKSVRSHSKMQQRLRSSQKGLNLS